MSEEKNIEESSKLQASSDKPKEDSELNKKNEQLETEPATNNQQPAFAEASAEKPATQNMEVHKHPHHVTHKKKWPEYLLEFLMLFLAVFLGFVAENLREHQVEKERANELAHSFYDELRGDSTAFHTVIQNRDRKNSSFMFLKKYFRDSSLVHCSKEFAVNFCYCFATFSPSVFQPKDAILEQLKNSGSLRYFKNPELQKLISKLSVNINDIRSRNQIELDFTQQNLLPFFIQHNDQEWFDKLGLDSNVFLVDKLRNYEVNSENIPFHFKKAEELDKSAAENMVGLYQIIFRGSLLRQYKDYETLNQKLLEALRKEYKIK